MATSSSSGGGKKLNIRLNSDHPQKTALIQIDNTTKVADIKSAAVKVTSIPSPLFITQHQLSTTPTPTQ